MRRLMLFALLALFAAAAHGKVPNLTGTWNVNIEKSEFAGPAPQSSVYRIRDAAEGFFITSVETRDGQERTVEFRFDRSGKETVNRIGNTEVRTVLKEDGDTLREESVFTSDSGGMTRKSTLSVSADGKTMTLDSAFTGGRGDFRIKLLLEKK